MTTIVLTDIKENLWGRELLLLLDPNRNVFGGTELPVRQGHQTVILNLMEAAEMRRCLILQGSGEGHVTLKGR